MASCALKELRPVRLLRQEETVKVYYLDTGAEFRLDAGKPLHIMHSVTSNDDATMIEVTDPNMVAVRQVGEDGQTQTLMLSPRMAMELARVLDSYVFFPIGLNTDK